MDFQSLPRRALQFLCKRNTIPANITNMAMAEALHSLQTVEGLDELEQKSQLSTITIPTRPPNPSRSCRRDSSFISTTSTSTKKRKEGERDMQELMDNATSKRSRTLSSIENHLPCAKTYCRRRKHCLVKPMLRCGSSVRQNDTVFESDESAIEKVGVKETRSIGIQVDIGDEIVANYVESSRCLALVERDDSCIASTEFAGSSIAHLPQQSIMVCPPMETDVLEGLALNSDAIFDSSSVAIPLPEQSAECSSMILLENASIAAVALNCDPIPEIIVGVHSESKEDKTMGEENEDAKIEMRVEIKAEKTSENKSYLSGLSLRKLRLLWREKNQKSIKLESSKRKVHSDAT